MLYSIAGGGYSLPRVIVKSALYNDAVPMKFTRALLAQARAYDRDVPAILRAARFPFDPLCQDVQTVYVLSLIHI